MMLLNGQPVGRNLEVGNQQMDRITPRISVERDGSVYYKSTKLDMSATFSFTVYTHTVAPADTVTLTFQAFLAISHFYPSPSLQSFLMKCED